MYRRAQQIGASCAALVLAILQSREHPENAVRSCLGVLSLARKHGNERLDIASGQSRWEPTILAS